MRKNMRKGALLLGVLLSLQSWVLGGCDWLIEVVENTSSTESIQSSFDNSITGSVEDVSSSMGEASVESSTVDSSVSEEDSISSEESSESLPCVHAETDGIVVTVQPRKTVYQVGETFDPSGMVVMTACKHCGEGMDIVQNYTIEYPSGKTAFQASDTFVIVACGEDRVAVAISVGEYTPSVPIE